MESRRMGKLPVKIWIFIAHMKRCKVIAVLELMNLGNFLATWMTIFDYGRFNQCVVDLTIFCFKKQ